MTPFFSIVIPVYNTARHLRACLESVRMQTYADWECLCVDDGSADGSCDLLAEYARKDARFKVFQSGHHGVSSARNLALANVAGKYVAFVDADDVLLPERLATASAILMRERTDLLRLKLTEWQGEPLASLPPRTDGQAYRGAACVFAWGVPVFMKEGWVHVVFIRRELVRRVRFPEGLARREDNIFLLRLLKGVGSAFEGEDCGYLYRQHAASVIHCPHRAEDSIRFLSELEAMAESPAYAPFRSLFARAFLAEAEGWLRYSGSPVPCKARKRFHDFLSLPHPLLKDVSAPVYTRISLFCFRRLSLMWPARLILRTLRGAVFLRRAFRVCFCVGRGTI